MYVRGKLSGDPIAEQLVALGRESSLLDVLDVGCGRGQMGIMLLEAGAATSVVGVEAKVEEGRTAARDLPMTLERGDVRTFEPLACDTLLLIDVLHYLTDREQIAVLERYMALTRKCVVLRELDPNRGWRSVTTRTQETVTTFLGYNVGERVRVLPIASFVDVLEAAGFAVRVIPSWGKTPFSNVAVIATRARGSAAVPP
jgi:trans-aconitate methyltransferase